MFKQILIILVFAAAISAFFYWLPGSRWRRPGFKSGQAVNRAARPGPELAGLFSGDDGSLRADSAGLKEILEFLAGGDLETGLQQWSDSVAVLDRRLEAYRGLFSAIRERVRSGNMDRDAGPRETYFQAVRRLRDLEWRSRELKARLDTLEVLKRAVEAAARREGDGSGGSRKPLEAAETCWLVPARVPVRQACLSCHRRPGSGPADLVVADTVSVCPEAMQQHPPDQFGCTSCHRGEPQGLDSDRAHGPDSLGRPFLPGKLALRSCGLCHGAQAVPWKTAARFPWPEDCLGCHQAGSLSAVRSDSVRAAFADSIGEGPELRAWLLRHWSGKSGLLPVREQFELALSLLSAREPGKQGATDTVAARAGEPGYRCPSCGRVFEALPGVKSPVCPVDGTGLIPDRR
ncbi:MAG: cytochrome c3 family protein [Candidatus Glassbacteria bacterium]|nr:cytochrome c3 family protein [Candidatus Glassbacteria bacterium]